MDNKIDILTFEKMLLEPSLSDNYSIDIIINFFNEENIRKFNQKYPYEMYKFLIYIIKKHQKEFEELLFTNFNLVKFFIEFDPAMYNGIKFHYVFLKNLINYLEKHQLSLKNISILVFISLESSERKKLLEEDISLSIKESILLNLDCQDASLYLTNTFLRFSNSTIYHLLTVGVSVSPKLYENKNFFQETILSKNFTSMRNNLNRLAEYVDISYFLKLKKSLFLSILKSYSKTSKQLLLNNKLASDFVVSYQKTFYNSPDVLKKLFINIVIDELFSDNVRNVCLNIEELLEYNKIVQVIPAKHLNFYWQVLSLFKMEKEDIINFYFQYQDQDIQSMFYDDIRNLKNLSYQKLNTIISSNYYQNLKNVKLSMVYQTDIYELNGEPFTFLVSCLSNVQENITDYRRNCYSIISNQNMSVFIENNIIFGYQNILIDHIMHIFENDACSNSFVGGTPYINRIRDLNFLLKNQKMNEIQIKNQELENNKYQRQKPSFIVCFDNIDEKSLEASKKLQIPIVIINRLKYQLLLRNNNLKNGSEDMYYNINILGITEDSYKTYRL